jgi:hypothetical protein
MVLPGLLQTEAYARAVLGGTGLIAHGDVERHLATRLARQGILRRDDPPQFTAVVDESVLRRPVGGPETMREQLHALVAACEQPHVRVHVVPSRVGAYAGLNGPFVIATSADHRVAGYLDTQLHGEVVSEPGDIAAILTAWENVRGEALSHWQSVDLITEVRLACLRRGARRGRLSHGDTTTGGLPARGATFSPPRPSLSFPVVPRMRRNE